MAGQSTGALMNALHAWPGWQLTRIAGEPYIACVWWNHERSFHLEAPRMGELARLLDECRLANPRPALEVEGAPE